MAQTITITDISDDPQTCEKCGEDGAGLFSCEVTGEDGYRSAPLCGECLCGFIAFITRSAFQMLGVQFIGMN